MSYIDILRAELPTFAEKLDMNASDIVFQDNDPKHTTKLTNACFQKNNITILE